MSITSGTAAPYGSLAEFYGRGDYAPFLRERRLAGSASAVLVRFSQPGGEFPDPPTPDYTLAINEHGAGEMRFDIGAGRRARPFRAGDLVLKPPGVSTFFANSHPHGKSFLSLPAPFVARVAEETGAPPPDALHADAFRSEALARLLGLLWAEPALEAPQARLFNDGLILAAVATLLGLGASRPQAAMPPGGLSPAKLARVEEWVAAHLSEPFGLAEMAASVCLSPWHFSRAFKAATGQTPRGFVAARRLALAKELLGRTAMPLAEVAQRCGFSDQPHFTTSFTRQVGLSPGAYRRTLRG